MARISKEERLRQEGFRIAYHLIKNEGLPAAETRLTRNEQTVCPVGIPQKEYKKFCDEVNKNFEELLEEESTKAKHNALATALGICLMALDNKYGFDEQTLIKFEDDYIDLVDTVYGKWMSFQDMVAYLEEKTGRNIIKFTELGEDIISKSEPILQHRKALMEEGKLK